MMLHSKAGPGVDPPLAEPEVVVTQVDGLAAVVADNVMVVRSLGPLEAAPALPPIDPVDLSLSLQTADEPEDRGVSGRRQLLGDAFVKLTKRKGLRMHPEDLRHEPRKARIPHHSRLLTNEN